MVLGGSLHKTLPEGERHPPKTHLHTIGDIEDIDTTGWGAGKILVFDAVGDLIVGDFLNVNLDQIPFGVQTGGGAISTGAKGWTRVPWNCTIIGWYLTADQVGAIVLDIWKSAYADFPPVLAGSLIGGSGTKPALAMAQKAYDETLTDWTVDLLAGDYLQLNVDSCSTLTEINFALAVRKSLT